VQGFGDEGCRDVEIAHSKEAAAEKHAAGLVEKQCLIRLFSTHGAYDWMCFRGRDSRTLRFWAGREISIPVVNAGLACQCDFNVPLERRNILCSPYGKRTGMWATFRYGFQLKRKPRDATVHVVQFAGVARRFLRELFFSTSQVCRERHSYDI
jgi:hypothetical protein